MPHSEPVMGLATCFQPPTRQPKADSDPKNANDVDRIQSSNTVLDKSNRPEATLNDIGFPTEPLSSFEESDPAQEQVSKDTCLPIFCVTGSADDCIVTSTLNYNTGELKIKHRVRVGGSGTADIQVRDDGRVCAIAGWDGRVRVHHVRTGKALAVLKYHRDGVAAVAFDPMSSRIASVSQDSTVAIWDVALA